MVRNLRPGGTVLGFDAKLGPLALIWVNAVLTGRLGLAALGLPDPVQDMGLSGRALFCYVVVPRPSSDLGFWIFTSTGLRVMGRGQAVRIFTTQPLLCLVCVPVTHIARGSTTLPQEMAVSTEISHSHTHTLSLSLSLPQGSRLRAPRKVGGGLEGDVMSPNGTDLHPFGKFPSCAANPR